MVAKEFAMMHEGSETWVHEGGFEPGAFSSNDVEEDDSKCPYVTPATAVRMCHEGLVETFWIEMSTES